MFKIAFLFAAIVAAIAAEAEAAAAKTTSIVLSPDTWEAETTNKAVMIKYFAPWCGHCKKLKPAWQKLAAEFKGSTTALIAEVDCTAEGHKPLCSAQGVRGYPTIMYGTDPNKLQKYTGDRSAESLIEFANDNLMPQCTPTNLDACSDRHKRDFTKFMALSADDLQDAIEEGEDIVADTKKTFDDSWSRLSIMKAVADILENADTFPEKVAAASSKNEEL